MADDAHVLEQGEGEALWFFGGLTEVKAEGDGYALLEQAFPGGVKGKVMSAASHYKIEIHGPLPP